METTTQKRFHAKSLTFAFTCPFAGCKTPETMFASELQKVAAACYNDDVPSLIDALIDHGALTLKQGEYVALCIMAAYEADMLTAQNVQALNDYVEEAYCYNC